MVIVFLIYIFREFYVKDTELEDSTFPESEDEDDSVSGSRPPGQIKPMTTRQAVLASRIDSSHVSLGVCLGRKPTQPNLTL